MLKLPTLQQQQQQQHEQSLALEFSFLATLLPGRLASSADAPPSSASATRPSPTLMPPSGDATPAFGTSTGSGGGAGSLNFTAREFIPGFGGSGGGSSDRAAAPVVATVTGFGSGGAAGGSGAAAAGLKPTAVEFKPGVSGLSGALRCGRKEWVVCLLDSWMLVLVRGVTAGPLSVLQPAGYHLPGHVPLPAVHVAPSQPGHASLQPVLPITDLPLMLCLPCLPALPAVLQPAERPTD